jgi:16S rRNA processing protein RimM
VRVEVRSDRPGRFKRGARLLCDDVGELVIERVRGDAKMPVIAFAGYADREQAATLAGKFLRIAREDARRAASGAYLWADLVGLRASSSSGTALGSVVELIRAGEADVLVIRDERGNEVLVPMLESTVKAIDVAAGTVVVDPQEELPG